MTLDTLIAAPTQLPRVNLLPQEVNEANRQRRLLVALGGMVAAAAGVTVLLTMNASSAVTAAQEEYDAAALRTTQLQAEVAQHRSASQVKVVLEGREELRDAALAQFVHWSHFLNGVQLQIPRSVRLLTWNVTLTDPAPVASTGTATAPGTAPATTEPSPDLTPAATWALTGQAKSLADIALLIESFQRLEAVDSVYVSNATEVQDQASGEVVWDFTLTARVNGHAYSEKGE